MRKLCISLLLISTFAAAQNDSSFQEEVEAMVQKYDTLWNADRETIVFAGSSSIRMWKDLENRFPDQQLINSGFGGSQASDLLYHIQPLILRFKPKKVFLYEGDNDIAAEKKSKVIIADLWKIIDKIRIQDPDTKVILIAAKPSIARWELKRNYKRLNRKFRKMARKNAFIEYADVWKPMLNGRKLKKEIFLDDGLHMNKQGYDIWYEVLKKYVID